MEESHLAYKEVKGQNYVRPENTQNLNSAGLIMLPIWQ